VRRETEAISGGSVYIVLASALVLDQRWCLLLNYWH
jgi:hypothetical protein